MITRKYRLNSKQIKILKYSAEGLTEKAQAMELKISINTIKYHKKKIFQLLEVETIMEAVIKALKYKLISINDIKD